MAPTDDGRRAGRKDCNGQVKVKDLWGNGAGEISPGVLGSALKGRCEGSAGCRKFSGASDAAAFFRPRGTGNKKAQPKLSLLVDFKGVWCAG